LSDRVRWGGRGAVDCTLVEGGREFDCGIVLHKGMEGCSDSRSRSDEVGVISVRDGVDGRVCCSNGLKRRVEND
jgi:hypothetical protein